METTDTAKKTLKLLLAYDIIDPTRLHGDQVKVQCPNPQHEDDNPSCSVSISKGLWNCFSCGEGGDMNKFVIMMEAKRGQPLDNLMDAILIAQGYEQPSSAINTDTNIYINIYINNNSKKDNVSPNEQRRNIYRFYKSLKNVDWINNPPTNYMFDRGYTPEILNKNRVKFNRTSVNPIVIPLLEDNNFKGIVSRRIDEVKDRKYVNSTGLGKNNILVGSINKAQPLFVVEGKADDLASKQLGMKYVSPLLGWKLSDYQLHKIGNSGIEIVLWGTDNDDKGDEGWIYAKSQFKRYYPHIKLIRFNFPQGIKDPGDMIRHPQDFKRIVDIALNYA